MPALDDKACYQVVKRVDIAPVLGLLEALPFFGINGHIQGDPNRPPCSVVLSTQFPPALHTFIEGLGLGGSPGRYVIRKLAPGQHIPLHTDAWMPNEVNWRRFQLPLVSHPDVQMRWPEQGVSVYLEPGALYEVRYSVPHEVIQGAPIDRVHLQLDQVDATI